MPLRGLRRMWSYRRICHARGAPMKSVLWYALAAYGEIAGCFAFWAWLTAKAALRVRWSGKAEHRTVSGTDKSTVTGDNAGHEKIDCWFVHTISPFRLPRAKADEYLTGARLS